MVPERVRQAGEVAVMDMMLVPVYADSDGDGGNNGQPRIQQTSAYALRK